MANTQTAFGFRHIGYLPGYAPDYQQLTRNIQSTYASTIGFGDPVQKSGAYIVQGAGGTNATGTAIIDGVFVGCQLTPKGGGIPQWAPGYLGQQAAADPVAYLINAPGALFLAATLLTAITTTNIGQTVCFNLGTASSTGGMLSGATVDQGTCTTADVKAPFKVVGLYTGVGNGSDPTSNYNWVVVTFNNQVFKTLVGA